MKNTVEGRKLTFKEKMQIKDLQPKQGNVEITADVVELSDVREFEKFGKPGRVCNAVLKDETGKIALTLWNEEIDSVKVGAKVKISNGWVNEWQGELQLSAGRFGKLEVVGEGDASASTAAAQEPDVTEEKL